MARVFYHLSKGDYSEVVFDSSCMMGEEGREGDGSELSLISEDSHECTPGLVDDHHDSLRGGSLSLRQLLGTSHYPAIFAMGLMFDSARSSMLFLASLFVTEASGSPRLVQLTGTAMMLLLLGGPLFGVISDRYDRRRTIIISLGTMTAVTFGVSAAIAMGVWGAVTASWWLIYPYCMLWGLADVLDATNRPTLVFDLLRSQGGAALLSTAVALRQLGGNIGGAAAMWLVGLAVEQLGMWAGFCVVAAELAAGLLFLLQVSSHYDIFKKSESLFLCKSTKYL